MNKKFTAVIEKSDLGYSAYIDDMAVYTTGNSITELRNNLFEALKLYFEEEKTVINRSDILMEIDLQQFFKHYKVLNASFLADKIQMNPALLSQYVQGKKKPSAKQTEKILNGIHDIGRELADINLVYSIH